MELFRGNLITSSNSSGISVMAIRLRYSKPAASIRQG